MARAFKGVESEKEWVGRSEKGVAELDIDPGKAMEQRSVRVITLQNSDAQTLAANLTAVFAEEQGKEPAPTIRVDPQSNSLIVRAHRSASVRPPTRTLSARSLSRLP